MFEQNITIRNRFAVLDQLIAVILHHAEFKKRRLLDLRFGAVLVRLRKPGQLDADAVAAGGLDDGFRHAETVNTFAQHFDGLRQRRARHIRTLRLKAVRVRREQDIRIHLDEKFRAALQIQTELDLARRVALKAIQDEQIRVNLILRADKGKILL